MRYAVCSMLLAGTILATVAPVSRADVIIPSGLAGVNGPFFGDILTRNTTGRLQITISGAALGLSVGDQITGIEFRAKRT